MNNEDKDTSEEKAGKNRKLIGYEHVGIEIAALRDLLSRRDPPGEKRKANIKHSQTTKDDETSSEKKK